MGNNFRGHQKQMMTIIDNPFNTTQFTTQDIIIYQSYFMIKLVIGKSAKLAKLKEPTLQQIRQIVKSFPNSPVQYTLTYVDRDGDEICINSDEEVGTMLALGLKTNKIFVKENISDSIDMTSFMSQKIDGIFDESEIQVRKGEEQIKLKSGEQVSKPSIKWFLKPNDSAVLGQENIQQPIQIIQASIKSVQQDPNISSQSLRKEVESSSRMDFARINSNQALQSNYLIYKKKQPQPKPRQLIDQPNLKQKEEDRFILHQTICFNCKQDYGIVGVRYLCLVCDSFNLCANCQKTVQHIHALLKIKTVQQTATIEQISQKIKNDILSAPKNIFHNINSAQPMQKDESNRFYLQIVQNYVKEGYQKSKRVFEEMITKLSGMKRNQNLFNKPNISRPFYTKTNEQKAASIQSIINGDYKKILDFCQRNNTLGEQELINLYLAQHN